MFSILALVATTNRAGIIISPCLVQASKMRDPQSRIQRMTIISELPPTLYPTVAAVVEEALHVDDDLVEPFEPF